MKTSIPIIILICVISMLEANADKIHLKSGKVMEGKLQECRSTSRFSIMGGGCCTQGEIAVNNDGSSRCIKKNDVKNVVKELKKPTGVALLAKEDAWGPEKDGYRTQLIANAKRYKVGKPIRISLVMKNFTKELKWFDKQGIRPYHLKIIGPDGKEVYYKASSFQTGGSEEPIDESEVYTLFDKLDITQYFAITLAGKYSIKVRELGSNKLIINIEEGKASESDLFLISIVNILPKKRWSISPTYGGTRPYGRERVKGIVLIFSRFARLKKDVVTFKLWRTNGIANTVTEAREVKEKWRPVGKKSDFIGSSGGYQFYLSDTKGVQKSWPDFRIALLKALKIRAPQKGTSSRNGLETGF